MKKKMISCDLSQIEPRVLAWCAGDQVMLNNLAAGQSPYEAHARATMGWTGTGKELKANKPLYGLAKVRILGLGYGCGWRKFIKVAKKLANLDITRNDPEWVQDTTREGEPIFNKDGTAKMVSGYGLNSKQIVREFREQNPLIASRETGLWARLDQAFKSSIGGDFELVLPSGRIMLYREVREGWTMVENEETGLMERRRAVTAEGFRDGRVVRLKLYGGLLAENLVQATARDVFAEHLLELEDTPGVTILFTCHDEAVLQVDENISANDIQKIMSKTPSWLEGCPIAAEAKEISCYCK